VLETVPDYDPIVFSYFDRLSLPPASVVLALWNSRRAAVSYFSHLLGMGTPAAAAEAWHALRRIEFADDPSAAAYLRFLLSQNQPDSAAEAWAAYLKERRDGYLRPSRLYNGDFQRKPTGAPLDWRIEPHTAVEASAGGLDGLTLRFQGTENVSYRNVTQTAVVSPGRYILKAKIKTDEITTNEGIHLHLTASGLDLRTEPLSGTRDWTPVELAFEVPASTRTVNVAVCRDPSKKFDNKINGVASVTAVTLMHE
jgi:hypothetical protein